MSALGRPERIWSPEPIPGVNLVSQSPRLGLRCRTQDSCTGVRHYWRCPSAGRERDWSYELTSATATGGRICQFVTCYRAQLVACYELRTRSISSYTPSCISTSTTRSTVRRSAKRSECRRRNTPHSQPPTRLQTQRRKLEKNESSFGSDCATPCVNARQRREIHSKL